MLPLDKHPGLIYVVATMLPLASFVILLIAGGVRQYLRPRKQESAACGALYAMLGGDAPGKVAAYVATAAIGLAFLCAVYGFVKFNSEAHAIEHKVKDLKEEIVKAQHELEHDDDQKARDKLKSLQSELAEKEGRWSGHTNWIRILPGNLSDNKHGTTLQVGFYIDQLAAVMFAMVTFIATLIHLFSIGYMSEELHQPVADHEVHTAHGHLHRRGRFGRFFLFLSLFCFSMLNLIIADNLFQVFVSWELVGICSFLLIGFYYERTSASNAANKAFITNRVGDAGFIIGLLIVWTYVGTLNFQEVFARIRCPDKAFSAARGEHGKRVNLEYAGLIVRAEPQNFKSANDGDMVRILKPDEGISPSTRVIIFPREPDGHFEGVGPQTRGNVKEVDVFERPKPDQYGSMPYWLMVAAGLGIFLGCVGKSAQFPLHVWLPDAMEGPTPVSALIHAATMVAAGVYLVGRCFPLFTPEAQLVIAYTGAITLTVAASIAVVMTDIKKVLAYSTVSQLGYMMLALGVGGWVAGLFHLITHAFFKALLFLGSGSVIYGCHHQQDMMKMGGLYPKMKITAITMLLGVLAIGGIPLFSGYYSKDAIMAEALGFFMVNKQHFLLFFLPLVTAGITAFYMSRMWFLTFTGKPRDAHVHEHAHESPWIMTVPLIILAIFSVSIAWGPEEVALENTLHHAMPHSVMADFGVEPEVDSVKDGKGQRTLTWSGGKTKPLSQNSRHLAHENHDLAGTMALGMGLAGILLASLLYYFRVLDPADSKEQFPGVYRLLASKWYFDELYSALFVRPALAVANWFRVFDTKVIDGIVDGSALATVKTSYWSGRFDNGIIDGLVNLTASVCFAIGAWLRRFQTGYIRSYILFLVLAAVVIWVILSFLLGTGAPAAGNF